jgi:hypothetical protein
MAKLVKCKVCGKDVASSAGTCPHCGVSYPAQKMTRAAWILVLGLFLILGWCAMNSNTPEKKEERAQSHCDDKWAAYSMSQEFVKKSLKAPSSAEFPRMEDSEVTVDYLGDCTHEVHAYVDSQNSFGAKLRSRYTVQLKNERGTSTWTSLNVRVF